MISSPSPGVRDSMPDIALRGISSELHQALKNAAEQNHRSLNGEILARLEASVEMTTVDVDALLARIQVRGNRYNTLGLDPEKLRELKQAGRP
jgi:hypothetical protein